MATARNEPDPTAGTGQIEEPDSGAGGESAREASTPQPPTTRWWNRLTHTQLAGLAVTAFSTVVGIAQILDYVKSGKVNLVWSSLLIVVGGAGLFALVYPKRNAKRQLIGAGIALVVVVALTGVFELLSDGSPDRRHPAAIASPSAPAPSSFQPTTSGPGTCATPTGAVVEQRDSFEEGPIDRCLWRSASASGFYAEKPGIRAAKVGGKLVFDKPQADTPGDDLEIEVGPRDILVEEVAVTITLPAHQPGRIDGGSAGLIAIFGDAGPKISIDGGPRKNSSPSMDISVCATRNTEYGECEHPDPCNSTRLPIGTGVRLRMIRAGASVEPWMNDTKCGSYHADQRVSLMKLNIYFDSGSRFRMDMDDFYLRYKVSQ
jgi:hypothetical protein